MNSCIVSVVRPATIYLVSAMSQTMSSQWGKIRMKQILVLASWSKESSLLAIAHVILACRYRSLHWKMPAHN